MTEPLRIVNELPPTDPAARLAADLTPRQLYELVAALHGITTKTGEVTLELVFRHGQFARGHKHETFTAAELHDEPSP